MRLHGELAQCLLPPHADVSGSPAPARTEPMMELRRGHLRGRAVISPTNLLGRVGIAPSPLVDW